MSKTEIDYRQSSGVDAAGGAAPQGGGDQPPTLAGKAGPMENRDTRGTSALLPEGGCSRGILLNAHCLLWEIRLLGAKNTGSDLIAELSANIW